MNNLPKVVTQQRRGRASNPRLLDRKSDALPLSHRLSNTSRVASRSDVDCRDLDTHVLGMYCGWFVSMF